MNKKSKRILSLLMSLIMVLSMFTGLNLSSFASGAEIVINYPEEFSVGDTITVTVSGVNMTGLESANISFYYDAEYLEFVNAEAIGEAYIDSCVLFSEGQINWGGVYYPSAASENIDFIEISFIVLNAGDSEFKAVCTNSSGISLPSESAFEISVCEHNYEVTEIVEPTCVDIGYTKYVCTLCGHSYNADYVDVTYEHNYEATETVEPTCVDSGYTKYACTICGACYYDYVSATESHDYEVIEQVDATCTDGGFSIYKCVKCEDEYTSYGLSHCTFESGSLYCKYCNKYAIGYEINNGEVKIIDCDESISGDIVIPETIEGYTVATIGSFSFSNCTLVKSVLIPESVKIIGERAFYRCELLECVTIPDSVEYIGANPFYETVYYNNEANWDDYVLYIGNHLIATKYGIKNCDIKNGTITIAGYAFKGSSVVDVVVPDSVITIGDWAFLECGSLENVKLSNNLKSIGEYAFYSCNSLKNIIIPINVEQIGECALGYNGYMSVVDDFKIEGYSESVAEKYAKANDLEFVVVNADSVDEKKFIDYLTYEVVDNKVIITDCDTSISGDIEIPSIINDYLVTSIGDDAFSDCSGITSVVIPDSVTEIGGSAFWKCTKLKKITLPDNIVRIGSGAFSDTEYYNDEANWEDDMLYIGKYLVGVKGNEEDRIVKKGTTVVSESVFGPSRCYCKSVTMQDGVEIIGDYAFSGNEALENIQLPDSVTEIGGYAFYTCHNLKSVVLPKGITEIKECTFNKCINLTDVTIPVGVTEIEASAFSNCSALKSINIPESVATIGNSAFSVCASLSEITIPAGVKSIGANAFYRCSATKITVLSKNVEIGNKAFGYSWNGLQENVEIHGYAGSTAEAYAKENGIEFVVLEEPTTQEPTTQEPTTQEPTTQEPSTENPAENGELDVKDDSGIDVDSENKTALIGEESRVEEITAAIENDSFKVLDKNGNELAADDLIGTGCKIQILGADGNILAEYTVIVPNDVDGNAKVNAADARLALRAGAKLDVIDELCYFTAADADGNGKINAADARKILRKAAGLE